MGKFKNIVVSNKNVISFLYFQNKLRFTKAKSWSLTCHRRIPSVGDPCTSPKKETPTARDYSPQKKAARRLFRSLSPFSPPLSLSASALAKLFLFGLGCRPLPLANHARCANTLPTICSPPNPWRCLQEPLHRQRSYEPQCAAGRSPAPLAGLQPRQQVCSASHVHGSTHPWIYLCFSFPCLDRDKLSG